MSEFTFFYVIPLLLIIKLGAAPFQGWFIRITLKINWNNFFWISTFQKIIPLIFLSYYLRRILIYLIVFSVVVASLSAYKQFNFKKLLAYSSVFRVNWIITSFVRSSRFWIKFIIIYGVIKICVIIINFNPKSTRNKSILRRRGLAASLINIFLLLAIIGLPPFPVFFLKLWVVRKTREIAPVLSLTLILASVLLIFLYISFCIKILTLRYETTFLAARKIRNKWKIYLSLITLIFLNIRVIILQKNTEFWFLFSLLTQSFVSLCSLSKSVVLKPQK